MKPKQSKNLEIAAPAFSGLAMTVLSLLLVTNPTSKGSAEMKLPDEHSIRRHLEQIVGERRPYSSDQHLNKVLRYIEDTFKKLGYEIERYPFSFSGKTYDNIIARKKGMRSNDKIIVGAHFDSVPGSPGADDNASGVAVMLELARILADRSWNHTIEFIGFHMEEWNMIGSNAYAEKLKEEKIKVHGMISLEMVGYVSDEPKSQKLPPGFGFFFPNVGNFIGIVGNMRSIKLANTFKTEMKSISDLPIEKLILPFNGIPVPATRLSDHSPFWDRGFPALLITDTSFYRNPNYHGANDTIETLNLPFMTKVTEGTSKALIALDEME